MIDLYSGLDFESPLCRIPFRKRRGIRATYGKFLSVLLTTSFILPLLFDFEEEARDEERCHAKLAIQYLFKRID
jgi:hypothetical protein